MHHPADHPATPQLPDPPVNGAALEHITEDVPRDDELHAYGRFWRRAAALALDMVVLTFGMFGLMLVLAALVVVVAMNSSFDPAEPGPLIGILSVVVVVPMVTAFALYEPLMVSRTGGTVGHHLLNLRVVPDEPDEQYLPFRWAMLRSIVKGFVGLPSFILMTVTGRNQALHDVITGSTVQIKDIARARENHYTLDRPAHEVTDVSRGRRVGMTLAYLAGLAAVNLGLDLTLPDVGAGLYLLRGVLSFVVGGVIVYLGWDGRLPGARSRSKSLAAAGQS